LSFLGSKTSKEKRTEDSADPTLPIILSVLPIVAIVAVIVVFVVYRKRRTVIKDSIAEKNYKFSENTVTESRRDDDITLTSNAPNYFALSSVQQNIHTPLYQGLNATQSHDKSPSETEQSVYQPLTPNPGVYQQLNKHSNSPVLYGNSCNEQNPVDGEEMYLTVLPDHESGCS